MSKRSKAKSAVLAILKEYRVCSSREVNYNDSLFLDLHFSLQDTYGYQNEGTRRCIINEVLRESGIAIPRDSFRRKTYRFEDKIIAGIMPAEFTTVCPSDYLVTLLSSLSQWLGIPAPELKFIPKGKSSFAFGSHTISLLEVHKNQHVLCHELTHIYGSAKGTFHFHCDKFLAVELLLFSKLAYISLDELINAATSYGMKVDLEYLNQVLESLPNAKQKL